MLGQVKGQKFIDVVGTLKEGLSLEVCFFEKIDDCLLELFCHLGTQSVLHDTDRIVIVLHSKDEIAYLVETSPI